MSVRRFVVLISCLPSDSALGRMGSSDAPETDDSNVTVITSGEGFASWMNSKAKKA